MFRNVVHLHEETGNLAIRSIPKIFPSETSEIGAIARLTIQENGP